MTAPATGTAIIQAPTTTGTTSLPGTITTADSRKDDDGSCVQVAVRVRPMLQFERGAGNMECVEVLSTNGKDMTVIRLGGDSGPKFAFDEVFPYTTSQHDVYENRVAPLVSSCLEGYNATILAYGQTGSGKTHTIMGPSTSITTSVQDELQAGVIPRAIRSVFDQLHQLKGEIGNGGNLTSGEGDTTGGAETPLFDYEIRVQFLEVYGEEIRDLLSVQQPSQKLSIRDVGMEEPEVVGATERKVDSAEEALLCLTRGMYRRVTGATAMNESSSRSHAILSLIVEQSTNAIDLNDKTNKSDDGGHTTTADPAAVQQHVQAKRSKFNFVDLAGSERQKRTQSSGQRLKEGIDINKGLLVLGNVISALGDPSRKGKTFVPYRDSKLTRLLKGSLGGNHKTLMIACVSPAAVNMEESLNCLRYANRAKNIQNHAVVNMDPTSRLLSELNGKMQMLAADLLKARDGKTSECTIPIEIVEQLANGEGGRSLASPEAAGSHPSRYVSPSPPTNFPKQRPQSTTTTSFSEPQPLNSIESNRLLGDMQKLMAENEVYRLRLEAQANSDNADDASDSLQLAFIARAAEYEREIAMLRQGTSSQNSTPQSAFDKTLSNQDSQQQPQLTPKTPNQKSQPDADLFVRSESPELSRLRAQAFGSMSQAQNLDAEMDAEEKAVGDLTTKYLKTSPDAELDDSLTAEEADSHMLSPQQGADATNESFSSVDKMSVKLEGDLFELSNSIDAKEELIQKLMLSQQKYEAMRDFYDKKLKEMGTLLEEKELETEKLSDELKKIDTNHVRGKELKDRLREKQQQVAALKKKQAELTRLTTVASKNQTQIEKLRKEVTDMKHKKVDLQKIITSERKNHAAEVQKLKKQSLQKDRELNKVKRASDRKAIEAQKAQQIAKSRLDQINYLKSKFKDTEKRQRMTTVKRGVMNKAGVDPIMVGRRQPKSNSRIVKANGKNAGVDVDTLRDFFDQKVADMGRKESLAEKLAQEWEAHFELTSSREELRKEGYEESGESIQSLDSQIQYKKERIRQLASRLGKRRMGSDDSKRADAYLFDQKFRDIVGNLSETEAPETAAKVLFGMVVRERRRIASLARTASSLDERVQEAEAVATAKDVAFRAYVDEQRLETAALAQDQQEHILSLMELVKEEPTETTGEENNLKTERAPDRAANGQELSKLLVLANERISALERQLDGLQSAREAVNKHREREEETRALYEAKSKECIDLEAELSELRSALRRIRENYALSDNLFSTPSFAIDSSSQSSNSQEIFQIVNRALHPSPAKSRSKTKRLRSPSLGQKIPESPTVSIKNQTKFVHTSDSEDFPDWAEDIMQDLAIIAEGKMPDSLIGSLEDTGEDSLDVHNDSQQSENKDVFDRLSSPTKFTGIQKQKQLQVNSRQKGRIQNEGSSEGQRRRKMISKQIADSLDKVVIPHANTPAKPLTVEDADQTQRRSVFDRLVSPSNLTGTQKQRFQDKKTKPGRSDSINLECSPEQAVPTKSKQPPPSKEIADEKSDDLLDDMLDDILSNDDQGSAAGSASQKAKSSANKRHQSKELSVFERLNKTTTQAYAVKQNVNIAEKLLDDILDDPDEEIFESHESQHPPIFERVEQYTKKNVFERLQQNTTEAYAVKHVTSDSETHDKRPNSAHGHPTSPTRQKPHSVLSPKGTALGSHSDHKDVFGRLQKHTTEAYAQKQHLK